VSHRQGRVGDRVREELSTLLRRELRDPRVGFVSVTDVEMSPDLRHARVYVSVLGSDAEESLRALNHAAPFLRRALAQSAGLRFTPQLRFLLDASLDQGQRVDELLDEVLPHDEPPVDEEPDA